VGPLVICVLVIFVDVCVNKERFSKEPEAARGRLE
jgi:hypothetical protein